MLHECCGHGLILRLTGRAVIATPWYYCDLVALAHRPSAFLTSRLEALVIIEGRVLSKEPDQTAVFEGVQQPYVRITIARLDNPDVHAEARIVDQRDIPV